MQRQVATFFMLLATSIVFVGCGSETPVVENNPPASSDQPIAADATPDKVVETFLNAMRQGDDKSTAALLTQKAREETERNGIVVQPPGSPESQFQVDSKVTVDAQNRATVKSVWSEPDNNGQSQSYEVDWVLQKHPVGWRISGLATEIVPGRKEFFNFEEPLDMLQKWEAADEEIRQAQLPSEGAGQQR